MTKPAYLILLSFAVLSACDRPQQKQKICIGTDDPTCTTIITVESKVLSGLVPERGWILWANQLDRNLWQSFNGYPSFAACDEVSVRRNDAYSRVADKKGVSQEVIVYCYPSDFDPRPR